MFLSRTAPTLLSRVQWLCQWRNVKLCQEDIVSLSQSKGPGWSPTMFQGRCVSHLVVLVELGEQVELVDSVEQLDLVD